VYHDIWSFLGSDPCIPLTRSDYYVRWIAEALERRGVVSFELSNGHLYGGSGELPYGLGKDFDSAYGCDQPKLTIADPAGTVQTERFNANEALITVTTPVGGVLIYRDAWAPGWQATVDGATVLVERNRDGFKTLVVPPGNHRINLVFRPLVGERSMLALALLLALSVVVQIWLACWGPRVLSPSSG